MGFCVVNKSIYKNEGKEAVVKFWGMQWDKINELKLKKWLLGKSIGKEITNFTRVKKQVYSL